MTTDLKKLAEVTQTPRTDALVQITEGGAQIFDRLWMLNHARTLELECTALKQEVETLRERLEITHVYDGDGNRVPAPDGIPDGISCRDETIRLQDEQINQLRERLARHEEAAPQEFLRWNKGEVWSFLRSVLSQGGAILLDYQNGKYKTYEEYAIRLDVAARERADELLAATLPSAPQDGETKP